MSISKNFDVIVVGSGISGLTCASFLTKKYKKRVLVLEQHFVAGGLTHEFKRKKYSWDVGVHYIGGVEEGSLGRHLFDYITNKEVRWEKLPYYFEHYIYPDLTFKVPSNMKRFEKALIRDFPEEITGIQQYFKDVKAVSYWYIMDIVLKNAKDKKFDNTLNPNLLPGKSLSLITTEKYLEANIKNSHLRSLLTSQWGNYGALPDESSFALHGLTVYSYFRGAYYPDGGAGVIEQSIRKIIEEGGGGILTRHEVDRLILKDGKTKGVSGIIKKNNSKETFTYNADIVISSIGMANTQKIIPKQALISDLDKIDHQRGYSGIAVYVGLNRDPRELDLDGESRWIHPGYDHRENMINTFDELTEKDPFLFLSFPSLKHSNKSDFHTAEIITLTDYHLFDSWEETSWRKRGKDYDQLKKVIAERFINIVDRLHPGFKESVSHIEVATPLTMKHFTSWPEGAFYGLIGSPARYRHGDQLKMVTSIEGFYLTGSDVAAPGIVGAAIGGMITAGKLSGKGEIESILSELSPEFKEIFSKDKDINIEV